MEMSTFAAINLTTLIITFVLRVASFAKWARVVVIQILNVKVHFCVALTTVHLEPRIWIAAQVLK